MIWKDYNLHIILYIKHFIAYYTAPFKQALDKRHIQMYINIHKHA